MALKPGRMRSVNWTEQERIVLVEEVMRMESIIFGKFQGTSAVGSGGVTSKDKDHAWEDVQNTVNAVSVQSNKTIDQCRKQYHNIKQRVKERHDDARYPKTGGGPPPSSPPPSQKLLGEWMATRPGIRGITQPLDTEDPKFCKEVAQSQCASPDVSAASSNYDEARENPGPSGAALANRQTDRQTEPSAKRQKKNMKEKSSLTEEREVLRLEGERAIAERRKLELECALLKQRIEQEKEKHENEMIILHEKNERHKAKLECILLKQKVLKEELESLLNNAVLQHALSS